MIGSFLGLPFSPHQFATAALAIANLLGFMDYRFTTADLD